MAHTLSTAHSQMCVGFRALCQKDNHGKYFSLDFTSPPSARFKGDSGLSGCY